MSKNEINSTIQMSLKWSGLTEILAKAIMPVSNMILARIITPEAFGVVAIVTMITSFADMFTDAGFQKYIIQHKFESDEELKKNANVAFWTNMGISILIWVIIAVFSKPIANLVGGKGYENVIIVSCSSLIFTAFSSIQMAIYKKGFDFKSLFQTRIVGLVVPFIITIPLALLGLSYWALVIGTISTNLFMAIILTIKSPWKPTFYYSFSRLKSMISFSGWILIESIFLWMTTWCATFIIGNSLSDYYLGIYKNSESMVNSILNIVVYSTSSVLLSILSSIKNDEKQYKDIFFKFQKNVSIFLIPIGVGIYIYRDLVTNIIFGSQWSEASLFVGLWALVNIFTILTGQYISIVFTSKGLPKLAVLSQLIQLIILVPSLRIGVNYGFEVLVVIRCICRLSYGIINLVIAQIWLDFSPIKVIKILVPAVMNSFGMLICAYILKEMSNSISWQFFSIIICIFVYFILSIINPYTKKESINIINTLKKYISNKV